MLRPLILTGGPAVGKSTTAARLARDHHRAALIDVDDVRHFVVAGHAAPWQGPEGLRQQRLGVENACALARHFASEDFEVLIADVVTPDTITLYRGRLPGCLVIRLVVTPEEAHRRAATREVHLTDAEFADLHARDRDSPPSADHHLDVTTMSVDEQAAAIGAMWRDRRVPVRGIVDVPIRTGEPSDAAFIVDMARLASAVEGRPLPPVDDPHLAQGLPPSPGTSVLATDHDGRPVGAAWWHFREPLLVVTPDGAPVPELVIAVVPADHGRGVGRRLLDALVARAAREGHDRLALNVHLNNPAARLYSRAGFVVAGKGRGPLGVAMVRDLP